MKSSNERWRLPVFKIIAMYPTNYSYDEQEYEWGKWKKTTFLLRHHCDLFPSQGMADQAQNHGGFRPQRVYPGNALRPQTMRWRQILSSFENAIEFVIEQDPHLERSTDLAVLLRMPFVATRNFMQQRKRKPSSPLSMHFSSQKMQRQLHPPSRMLLKPAAKRPIPLVKKVTPV